MKKYSHIHIVTALSIIVLALPAFVRAETAALEVRTTDDTDVILDSREKPVPPAMSAGDKQKMLEAKKEAAERMLKEKNRLAPVATTTKARLAPLTNKEVEVRKDMLRTAAGTTTRKELEVRKDMLRKDDDRREEVSPRLLTPLMRKVASSTMFASSTMMERLKEYRENEKQTRLDLFVAKHNRLVEQLTRALDNIKQIRERVSARIDKESQDNRDMTSAKGLLVTADTAIATAATAIQTLSAYTPSAASSTSAELNASANVDLEKPRVIGADAIKAVNDARKALNDVVVAIARAMGLKTGDNATSSSPTQ